ncbi:hypothetical protein QJS66_16175 [Kocuria rhizophila]|nr:hypothetical protein QJS66_16175 [Kocuria rhizophila]
MTSPGIVDTPTLGSGGRGRTAPPSAVCPVPAPPGPARGVRATRRDDRGARCT